MSSSLAVVAETLEVTPRIRRIALDVLDPAALAVAPGADSAVAVYFDATAPEEGRNYTVRRHDRNRVTIDVVLHERGPGTAWVIATRPGDQVVLDHARSWYRRPGGCDWQLLLADLSGLPALARIIGELPGGLPTTAIVDVVDDSDLRYLPQHPDVTVLASIGAGNGCAPGSLAERMAQVDSPGTGYCWFAGEAAESRQIRKHLRARGWRIDQYDITGYWRRDSETWDARFALVENDVVAVYERALTAGKSEKVAFEEFDDALERAGL